MSNKPNFGKRRKLSSSDAESLMHLSEEMAPTPQAAISNFVHLAQGYEIPGGCDHCDSFQTVEPDPDYRSVSHLRIHHDGACPILALARERGVAE